MVLKGVPSGGTRVEVEELWWEEAILYFEVERLFYRQNCSEATADLKADNTVRHGSY